MCIRKTNLVFATVWFVYWSRKEMGFLCKKAFQQDPSSCWANTTATDYKQAKGPTPGPGPYATDPLLTSAFLFFSSVFPTASTHRGFSTFSQRTENHFQTGGLVLILMVTGSTKRLVKGLKLGWSCWVRVHGPRDSKSIISCSQIFKSEMNRNTLCPKKQGEG